MKPLEECGTVIDGAPECCRNIRTLMRFDGPRLLVARHTPESHELLGGFALSDHLGEGDLYLESWVDMDWTTQWHRMLVVRTQKESVEAYVRGEISMLDLIHKHAEGKALLMDEAILDNEAEPRACFIRLEDINPDYLPDPTAFYDASLSDGDPEWAE